MLKLKKVTIILSATAALLSAVGTGMALAQEGPRFVFRGTSGLLPMQVAAAPEDNGETGSGSGGADALAHMRVTLSNGIVVECRSSDEFPGISPEQIAAGLVGRTLTMTGAGTARASLPDYLTPGRPLMTTDWTFGATGVHAPRSGCSYGDGYQDGSGDDWTASVVLERGNLPLPGGVLTIASADVTRKARYARADVPAAPEPAPGILVVEFAGGWEARCVSGWSSGQIVSNMALLETQTAGRKTLPAVGTVAADDSFTYESDALRVTRTAGSVATGDGERLGSLPSPCLTNAVVEAGEATAGDYAVTAVDYLP